MVRRNHQDRPVDSQGVATPDPNGEPVAWMTYDPWGQPRTTEGEGSRLGFQGDVTDPETGDADMGARMYDPQYGASLRWTRAAGSLRNPMTLNEYGYASSSPISMHDPTGERQQARGCGGGEGSGGGSGGGGGEAPVDGWVAPAVGGEYSTGWVTLPLSRCRGGAK
jgi:RHS repeat-associated protein